MLLDPKRTIDPRDNLDKATRRELIEWAQVNNVTEVKEGMPADDVEGKPGTGIRNILRAKGLSRIPVPNRSINQHGSVKTFPMKDRKPAPPPQATMDEWEEFQDFRRWKAAQGARKLPAPVAAATPDQPASDKPVAEMDMNELRRECKRLNIKVERTDRMPNLREKIAAHGQDASELRQ